MKHFALCLLIPMAALAGDPVFSITPISALPTFVPLEGTVTAQYLVTNTTPYTLTDNGLRFSPDGKTPVGVTQTTGGSNCPDPFTLASGQSCILNLTIHGSSLIDHQAIGGPEVCNSKAYPVRCTIPTLADQLNVRSYSLSIIGGNQSTGALMPLVMQSTAPGNDWVQANLPILNPVSGFFQTSSCNDILCVVGGGSLNVSNDILLNYTIDGGNTWQYQDLSSITPADPPHTSRFLSSFCTTDRCILGGGGLTFLGTSVPLIVSQFNDGTWASFDLSSIASIGNLYSISCSDQFCIAVGAMGTNLDQPFIIKSTDGGDIWTQITTTGVNSNAEFNTVACTPDLCVVGGEYTAAPYNAILLQAAADGTNWQSVDLTGYGFAVIEGISCIDNTCVAEGETFASTGILLQNTGSAGAWVESILPVNFSLNTNVPLGVSCTAQVCAVSAINAITDEAYVIQNQISTLSSAWQVVDLGVQGEIGALSCNGTYCVAATSNMGGSSSIYANQKVPSGAWTVATQKNPPAATDFVSVTAGSN